jgi:hypothetical protein
MHRPLAIERPSERVNDTSQQSIAHGYVHDPTGTPDFISRVEMPVLAEQYHADFVCVHVERNAEHVAGKRHQFIKAHTREPRHLGDTGSDTSDRTHLLWCQLRCEGFSHLAYAGKRTVKNVLEALRFHAHWLFFFGLGSSFLGSAWTWGVSLSFRSSSTPFFNDAR